MFFKISLVFFTLLGFSCSSKNVTLNTPKPQEFSQIDINKDSKISIEEFNLASHGNGELDPVGPSVAFAVILFLIILFCFMARRVSKKQ